jgi:hypothetical protein
MTEPTSSFGMTLGEYGAMKDPGSRGVLNSIPPTERQCSKEIPIRSRISDTISKVGRI